MRTMSYQSPFSQSTESPQLTAFDFLMKASPALEQYISAHKKDEDMMMEFQMLNTALHEFVKFYESNNLGDFFNTTEESVWIELRDSITEVPFMLTIKVWERRLKAIRAFIKSLGMDDVLKEILGLN